MTLQFNDQEFSNQLDAINTAAKNGALKTLQNLHAQLMAQHNGYIDNPNARELLETQPMAEAAYHNHLACVRFLLPLSDLKNPWSRALPRAVENGHVECVKLLLPHSADTLIREALVAGAHDEQWGCVAVILDRLDAQSHATFQEDLETALLWASQYQQHDMLQRLYPLCNIERVLKYAKGRWDDDELLALTDYHTSVQQHKRLSAEVEAPRLPHRSKI